MKVKNITIDTTINIFEFIGLFTDADLKAELNRREFEKEQKLKRPKINIEDLPF